MKNFKFLIQLLFISVLFITFSSCEDDESTPDYVGTWSMEQSIDWGDATIRVNSVLTLTESTVESIGQSLEGVNLFGMKGDISVSGSTLIITTTSIGSAGITGELTWINKGDEGWDAAFSETGMLENQPAEYIVVANILTLTMEGGVPQIYTKK